MIARLFGGMGSDQTPATATPCRGRIVEFGVDSGTIETEHGTTVRFGKSSCSGLTPKIGLDVWVMALRRYPLIGERATLVNLTGEQEPSDTAERGRLRYEQRQAELRAQHRAKADDKARLRGRAYAGELPAGWSPSLATLAEVIELPAGLYKLAARPSEVDERADGPGVSALTLEEAARVADAVQDADDARRVVFGPCSPWPFFHPGLVPFAQLVGEEPDAFAVAYHPDRGVLPVWYVRHDDEPEPIADDPQAFLAALLDGRLDISGDAIVARPDLAGALGLPIAAELAEPNADELGTDAAFEALVDAELDDDPVAVLELAERLEATYRQRGWTYHARCIRWQLRRYFDG